MRAGAPSPARVLSNYLRRPNGQTANVSFCRFYRPISSCPCKHARLTCFGIPPLCQQWLSSSGRVRCCTATAQKNRRPASQ